MNEHRSDRKGNRKPEPASADMHESESPEKECVYQRALELQSHQDSYEDQKQALDLFQSIYFYKDADRHANQCTFRAWEIRWEKRKKIAFKVIPVVAMVAIVAFIAFFVNQDIEKNRAEQQALAVKYDQAAELVENGEYALAIDAFTKLGDYSDAAERVEDIRATLEENQLMGLRNSQVGDRVEFGFYHDHDTGRYGNEWQVLARDGDRLLLITNTTVGMRKYNDSENDISWQNSTLRTWLNGEFMEDAFTDSQRDMVQTTDVTCDDGTVVQDRCYIISADEARELFQATEDWEINHDRTTTDNWWLRSSSTDSEHKDIGWMNGSLFLDGYTPTSTCGVRVAVWVEVPPA